MIFVRFTLFDNDVQLSLHSNTDYYTLFTIYTKNIVSSFQNLSRLWFSKGKKTTGHRILLKNYWLAKYDFSCHFGIMKTLKKLFETGVNNVSGLVKLKNSLSTILRE